MNPCPCGYSGSKLRECRCSPDQVDRYRQRISGPLLDRIDLQIWVSELKVAEIRSAAAGEASAAVRQRVTRARERQMSRQGCPNALLNGSGLQRHCALGSREEQMLSQAVDRLRLSARGCDRVRRMARTIADLADAPGIQILHLGEAIQYRQMERRQ